MSEGARHRWDYQARKPSQATARSCFWCWAQGRRQAAGKGRWSTRMPDGAFSMTHAFPCPGTPWVREMHPDGLRYCLYDATPERNLVGDIRARALMLFPRDQVWQLFPMWADLPQPSPDAWRELEHSWCRLSAIGLWVLRLDDGGEMSIGDDEISEMGSVMTRQYIANMDLPPLPEDAFKVIPPRAREKVSQ